MSRLIKEMVILGLAALSLLYLMLPTFGIFEIVPDVIPIFGWLDEGTATLILANTLRYYGLDLTSLYGNRKEKPHQRRVYRREDDDVITLDDDQVRRK